MSDEIKTKLQESLQFFNQDIGQLIKNAQPIRTILEELEGKLPESIEEALTPAAFIECHRVQFLRAQKQLIDPLQQEQIANQRDNFKAHVESTCTEIDQLNNAQVVLRRNKVEL